MMWTGACLAEFGEDLNEASSLKENAGRIMGGSAGVCSLPEEGSVRVPAQGPERCRNESGKGPEPQAPPEQL